MGRKSRLKQEREHIVVKEQEIFGFDKILLNVTKIGIYLMLLTPLIVSYKFLFPFVAPKGFYLMALIEIVFFSWVILAFRNFQFRPRINNILKAFAVFIAVLTLSTIFSTDIGRSFWSKPERMSGLLMWLHLFGLYLVLSSVFKKKDWLKLFISSIGVSIVVCLFFLLEKTGAITNYVGFWGATVGNSSFMATYLLFNMFFAIYSFFTIKKEKLYSTGVLNFIIFGFTCMFATIMFSTARAAIASFFGGIIILVLFLLTQGKWKNLAKTFLIIGAIVYLCSMALFLWTDGPVHEKFSEYATRSRQVVWSSAWKGFLDKPILGWGMGNFSFVFHKYFEPRMYLAEEYGPDTRFDRAHNIVFDNLIDAGILGLISYISLYLIIFLECFKKYKLNKIDLLCATIPVSLLIAHFTQNLTVFDMPVSFLMMMLTFAFVTSMGNEEKIEKPSIKSLMVSIVCGILLIACFITFVFLPARAATGPVKIILSKNFEERELYYARTFESSPSGQHQIRIRTANLLDELSRMNAVTADDFKIVLKYLEERIGDNPYDYYARLTLGRGYRLYSKFDASKLKDAERVLSQAITISPTKQEVYWELAKVKSGLGDQETAYMLLNKAIELEPTVYYSHRLMLLFLIDLNQFELAEQHLQRAIEFMPGMEDVIREFYQGELDKK